MINICHIISGDLWAGAEVMDYQLLKKLKKYENLNLSVILLNEGRLACEIRSLGIPLDVVDERKRSFFQLIRDIGQILIRQSPDIVHAHRYKENILVFLSSKYQNGIQLVTTQHGMPESFGANRNMKYRFLHKLNILLLSKYFRKVVAVSMDIRNVFINKYFFPDNKMAMIHNGTEIPCDISKRKEMDVFRIGSMGRIYPVKDYTLMVEIAKEISQETENIRFELAGDGPEREKILDLIERCGLGKMFLVKGFIEKPLLFYQGLDLYLNTSFHEGIPLSVLEAMSHGIPVVVPNVGGLKEMVKDGIEGYLVEGRDPKAFARRCLLLYKNDVLRQSLGYSARERVIKEFSNDRMALDYYHLYLEITRGSAR